VFSPDAILPEALCLQVLSVAARYGNPTLATQVFDAIANLKIPFREHHFYPLIEAYTRAKELRNAFIVIGLMRESCPTPPRYYQLNLLIHLIAQSGQTVDRAYFILQDMVTKEGKKIDTEAVNVLLAACIRLRDVSRAVTTYRDVSTLNVKPNIDTFNILLDAARLVGHKELCMQILSDLKAQNLTPNAKTYEMIIATFLSIPTEEYEPAFIYLEEMKAAGFIPKWGTYKRFVTKCVYHRDERAAKILEEMHNFGLATGKLRRQIANDKPRVTYSQREGRFQRRMATVWSSEAETQREVENYLEHQEAAEEEDGQESFVKADGHQ